MQQESGGAWAILRLRLFKALAWIWRFRTFALANTAFKYCKAPFIVTRRFFGYELYLDVSRSNAQRQLYLVGKRFVNEAVLVNSLLKPGATVVDVGANIGYYVLLIANAVGANGRIVAFEPEPDNLIELRLNVKGNSLSNVDVRACAVGSETGEIAFETGLNGRICDNVARNAVRVPIVTLDSALTEPIDVIKIDVEGYEGQVLVGAENTIKHRRPSLFVEIHPTLMYEEHTVDGVLDFLQHYYSDIKLYQSAARPGFAQKLGRYLGRANTVELASQGVRLACREGKQDTFWAVCRTKGHGRCE